MMQFSPASKTSIRARIGLVGPSGSGKTYTALSLATGMGSRIAVIDTEFGSSRRYADMFKFDVLDLTRHSPSDYVDAINLAGRVGYDVLIIDSFSHAWVGIDGALAQVDAHGLANKGNTFGGWAKVTPRMQKLTATILAAPMHIICTMRAKTEYVLEASKGGKTTPRKVGLAPVQRQDVEYEFDILCWLDHDHDLRIDKTRMRELDGHIEHRPGASLGQQIVAWCSNGSPVVSPIVSPVMLPVDDASAALRSDETVTSTQLATELLRGLSLRDAVSQAIESCRPRHAEWIDKLADHCCRQGEGLVHRYQGALAAGAKPLAAVKTLGLTDEALLRCIHSSLAAVMEVDSTPRTANVSDVIIHATTKGQSS